MVVNEALNRTDYRTCVPINSVRHVTSWSAHEWLICRLARENVFPEFSSAFIYERFSGECGGLNGIPDGWEERQPEEVRVAIEKSVGNVFSADAL
jgi:hypothetical protein